MTHLMTVVLEFEVCRHIILTTSHRNNGIPAHLNYALSCVSLLTKNLTENGTVTFVYFVEHFACLFCLYS